MTVSLRGVDQNLRFPKPLGLGCILPFSECWSGDAEALTMPDSLGHSPFSLYP